MSVKEFNLPDPGEGLTEAEIVTWKVKAGDTVKVNDIVVEIETAKSLVELPVPFAGTVTSLLVDEGQTVEVGTPIIAVDTAGGAGASAPTSVQEAPAAGAVEPGMEGSPAPKMAAAAAAAEAEEQIEEGKIGGTTSTGRTAVLVGYGVKQTEAKRRPRKQGGAPAGGVAARSQAPFPAEQSVAAPAAPAVPAAPAQPVAPAVAREGGARALAKPPVRKFAKDLGVDLASVRGSGEGGIITRADVEAHAAGAAAGAQAPAAAAEPAAAGEAAAYHGTGLRPLGRARAAPPHQGRAQDDGPGHGRLRVHGAARHRVDHRRRHGDDGARRAAEDQDREFKDVKVTPLLVLAKAMCVAIRRNPEINATWDEAAGEIVVKNYVNLGIAAATPRGLIVPNVKDADQMSMRQLAEAIGALTATAREGRTQPADMSGGTITITNVGVFGVDLGTPIINPGESAIMAFGAIRREPWVVTAADGTESIEPRWVTRLALSFDHRLIDGELGSKFLADVAKVMEDPARGLVWG